MSSEFYVLLPSNTICPEFENNTVSHFTISFPKNLELDIGEWEVALCEIAYPQTWFNIEDNTVITGKRTLDGSPRSDTIRAGYYTDPNELAEHINTVLNHFGLGSKFVYSTADNKMRIYVKSWNHIEMDRNLADFLGFKDANIRFHDLPENLGNDSIKRVEADTEIDLMTRHQNLYIYTDIVKPTLVGNTYMPLLRTVTTGAKNKQRYKCINYTSPHYIPLSSNYIKQITIDIRDGYGDSVKFRTGKVLVKLHFRQTK